MREKKIQKTNFTSISESEKEHLKKRIFTSVYSYKSKKQRVRYSIGIAASIAMIISIGLYNYKIGTSSIDGYVKTIKSVNSEDFENVKLILSDNQNIDIAQDNSTIKYSTTGQQVKIGASKTINQSILKGEEVAYNTVVVPFGKRSQVELSDGSKVWLNSGSKLVYPVTFNENKREVYLEGEGIFEVRHDKNHPFMVVADNHKIEVLGTVFNVSNYSDENTISTTLKSGSVQINYIGNSFFKSNKTLKISPGSMTSYNKKTKHIDSKKVDVEKYFSWKEGIFIFKNDNLKFIMKRLSRYYNVDIVIEDKNLANQTFSGHLDLKDDVERVVQIIKETTSFKYKKITNNKIIIN